MQVLCDRRSATARLLSEALNPDLEGTINWTGGRVDIEGLEQPVLNAESRTDKLAQLVRLEHQGVSVPEWDLSGHGEDWYPRTRNHQQGRDFTGSIAPGEIAFYTRRLPLSAEWRLHFFRTKKGNIRLLRSGQKVPRVLSPHPWVRSHRLGWKISYTGGAPEDAVRQGRAAIEALNLDFGAVDLGLSEYAAVVLEVNTCPGLEAGTLERYVDAIEERLER
jgi:hypothetical protein